MNAKQKTYDLKLQKIQNALVKTNACIASGINDIMCLLKDNTESKIPRKTLKASLELSIKKCMDASTLTSGINAYTNKLRRDFLSSNSNLLRGILSDPNIDKGEFLFGENVTKRITEFKTSLNSLKPYNSKNFSRLSKTQRDRKSGYNKSAYSTNKSEGKPKHWKKKGKKN